MRILVIGSGFLATQIVNLLEAQGHTLLVFSRTRNLNFNCQQIVGDIFKFKNFLKVMSLQPSVVINTAWITKADSYKSHPSNLLYAQFAVALGQHISTSEVEHYIVLGSCAEYGLQRYPSVAGITEINPNNYYAEQKVSAFKSLESHFRNLNTRFTWARVFFPYGPGQDPRRLVPFLLDSIQKGHLIELNDVHSVTDWVSSRDIGSAINWIIDHELPQEVDIGTTEGFTNVELLFAMQNILQRQANFVSLTADKIHDVQIRVVGKNSPLILSGWSPRDTLLTGLQWVTEL